MPIDLCRNIQFLPRRLAAMFTLARRTEHTSLCWPYKYVLKYTYTLSHSFLVGANLATTDTTH